MNFQNTPLAENIPVETSNTSSLSSVANPNLLRKNFLESNERVAKSYGERLHDLLSNANFGESLVSGYDWDKARIETTESILIPSTDGSLPLRILMGSKAEELQQRGAYANTTSNAIEIIMPTDKILKYQNLIQNAGATVTRDFNETDIPEVFASVLIHEKEHEAHKGTEFQAFNAQISYLQKAGLVSDFSSEVPLKLSMIYSGSYYAESLLSNFKPPFSEDLLQYLPTGDKFVEYRNRIADGHNAIADYVNDPNWLNSDYGKEFLEGIQNTLFLQAQESLKNEGLTPLEKVHSAHFIADSQYKEFLDLISNTPYSS